MWYSLLCATTAPFDGLLGCSGGVVWSGIFPCDLVMMLQCIHRGYRRTSRVPLCHCLLSSIVQKVGWVLTETLQLYLAASLVADTLPFLEALQLQWLPCGCCC